jgi:hypothetical protein
MIMRTPLVALLLAAGSAGAEPPVRFTDVTEIVGLGGLAAARVAFADLNGDGRPDAIIDRHRLFLNTPDAKAELGFRFVEVAAAGLPALGARDLIVFADLDGDGIPDAIVTRYAEPAKPSDEPVDGEAAEPARTGWLKGLGGGTFGPLQDIGAASRATTSAIAVGDVNLDGRLDLFLGNWYSRYGQSVEAFPGDLLIQSGGDGEVVFARHPLAEEEQAFDEATDLAGRPTYGVMMADLIQWAPRARPTPPAEDAEAAEEGDAATVRTPMHTRRSPQLLELNYGRRANRLWTVEGVVGDAGGRVASRDMAPQLGLDGDAVRHGRYPDWLKIVAQRDARFDRADEKPFRTHGNTFDAAVGDVNNDGQFDLFLAEITHGWAGDSSDRSRLLIASQVEADPLTTFVPSPHSFDRIPPIPAPDESGRWPDGWFPRWNQGDLFCEFVDLDHDGLLDVILSSGDYPDAAPFDQRLRLYRQHEDGSFHDVTAGSGIDHVGSQQISLGDVDGDGRLDLLVGQSFNRFTPEMIAAAGGSEGKPRVRLFLNRTHTTGEAAPAAAPEVRPADGAGDENGEEPDPPMPPRVNNAITLTLIGDPAQGVNREALGAIVRLHTSAPGRAAYQSRQLIGIGGHAGKQHQFLVHFGLGTAERAERIEIIWPGAYEITTTLPNVSPGHHVVRLAPELP